jgi:monoamine oxidase
MDDSSEQRAGALRVCVIGAGAAGLAAADQLASARWDVTVIEARDRIGGRCAHATLAGVDVDLGAEFSHGRGAVLDLCADAGVPTRPLYSYDEDAAPALRTRLWVSGALVDGNGVDDATTASCRALYDELLSEPRWDGAQHAHADCSFAALARERNLAEPVACALDALHCVEYASCLADVGVMEWRRREEVLGGLDTGTDYSLHGKYTCALAHLASRATRAGARLRLSRAVRCVQAFDDHALVDGERFERVVVTVPLGVLQRGQLLLEGVGAPFLAAVSAVRFHAASKVVVAVAAAEWARRVRAQPAAPMVLSASAEAFAKQIWTRRARPASVTAAGEGDGGDGDGDDDVMIVTGFLAGPRDAAVAEALSCDEAAARLMAQVERTLSCDAPIAWLDALKVDWGHDPWALGAYSSPTVGAYDAWRALQETGSRTLLYAGEAAHERGSTVDSALESGRRAASELILRNMHS